MGNYYSDSTNINTIPIIKVGEVRSIIDNTKSGRIKVRITGIDTEGDSDLIDCVPLLPKYLVTLPKVGECVFVFQYEYNDSSPTSSFKNTRFWIGPLITQPTNLNEEQYNSALSILPDGYIKLSDPKVEPGTYGDDEDIVLQGRYNTDIIQKDREMWLRVGKTLESDPRKYNDKNLGYIQLKYGNEKLKRVVEDKVIQTNIIPIPDTLVIVEINTITNSGVILSGDLEESRYRESDINRTEVFIRVYDIKSNTLKTSFEDESSFVGSQSRDLALTAVKTFVDANKGTKWKIKSTAKDYLNTLPNVSGNISVFTSTPIPGPKKTIKTVRLEKNTGSKSSVVNVVANKINLISHDGEHTFNLTDPKGLITDEEQEKINKEAHPLVYGDTLVEFLELVKKYVISHVHAYHGLPADPSTTTTDVIRFDLNRILNKNINSN
jgi:hypothetical protein